jgi:hypothetical protein
MYNLFISYDGLIGSGKIFLDGSLAVAPVKGARYSPGKGERSIDQLGRQVITEEIQVDLTGSYRTITDWITALNVRLEILKQHASHVPTSRLILCVQEADQASNYYWVSDILDAWLFLDPNGLAQRAGNQQLLTLKLTRLDRWESTNTTLLSIAFAAGGSQGAQGYMLNHTDSTAGHANWGYVSTALTGDLPARCSLQFKTSQVGLSLGDALLGCGWADTGMPNVANILPTIEETAMTAGTGVTKSSSVSAACSGGNYATFTWSTTAETQLFKCTVPANLYAQSLSQGRPFKPFIRLQAAAVYTDLWLKIKVLVGPSSTVVLDSEYVLYTANSQIIEFPPIYLPPDGVQETESIEVSIYALKASGAAYTLSVDFLQLWPVDGGFRRYHGVNYISGVGQLREQPTSLGAPLGGGEVYWSNNSLTQSRAVYIGSGAPILANPGKTNVLAFIHLQAGASWVIDDQIQLYLTAIPAKRNL